MRILMILFCFMVVSGNDLPLLSIKGHHKIGVLMQMRPGSGTDRCEGPIEPWILQEIATLEWSLATISNQTEDSPSIGMDIYDSCGNTDRLIRQATRLATGSDGNPLIGIISAGPVLETNVVASYLHAFSIPLISTRNPDKKVLKKMDNLFVTAPHLQAQMQAVVSLIKKYDIYRARLVSSYEKINVISESPQALSSLSRLAVENQLEIGSLLLDQELADDKLVDKVKGFVESELEFPGIIVCLVQSRTVNLLAREMERYNIIQSKVLWIFAIVDGESSQNDLDIKQMMLTFGSATVVEPQSPMLPGLQEYLEDSFTTNRSIIRSLLHLLPKNSNCREETEPNQRCKMNHTLSGTRATSIVKAVSSLTAAFRLVQIQSCPEDLKCTNTLPSNIAKDIVESLKKLSYSVQGGSDNIRYTVDGRFLTTYTISRVSMTGLRQIGRYREDTNLLRLSRKRRHEDELFSSFQDVQEDNVNLEMDVDNETRYEIGILYYPTVFPQSRAVVGTIVTALILFAIWILVVFCKVLHHHYKEGTVPLYYYVLDSGMCVVSLSTYAMAMLFILPPSYTTCEIRGRYMWFCVAMCYVVLATHVFLKRSVLKKKNVYDDFYKTICLILISAFGIGYGLKKRLYPPHDLSPRELVETVILICFKDLMEDFLVPTFFPSWILLCFTLNMANKRADPDCLEAKRLCKLFVLHFVLLTAWICSYTVIGFPLIPLVAGCVLIVLVTSIVIIYYLPQTKIIQQNSNSSREKKLSTQSISMAVAHQDHGLEALRPPAPFCDPPKDRSPQELPVMRPWRVDLHESPILRYNIPPPPPPPLSCQPLYDSIPRCHQYARYP